MIQRITKDLAIPKEKYAENSAKTSDVRESGGDKELKSLATAVSKTVTVES